MSIKARRVMMDIADFFKTTRKDLICTGYEDDMSVVEVKIKGPEDSPYDGGWFNVRFRIPDDYPATPPEVTFLTKVWHPNISDDSGTVCMNVISQSWKAAHTLLGIADAAQTLLITPNPDSPLNAEAAILLESDQQLYNENAIMWTHLFAGGNEVVARLQEKVEHLMEFGFSEEAALKKCTENEWDMKMVEASL